MTLPRYLRRCKRPILLANALIFIALVWINWYVSKQQFEKVKRCNMWFPDTNCAKNLVFTREIIKHRKVDNSEMFNLTRIMQKLSVSLHGENVSHGVDDTLVCKRPNYDLSHDSVKYAFYAMGVLNCSNNDIFHSNKTGVFRLDTRRLGDRLIDRCEYRGIDFETDQYFMYTSPPIKNESPFDVVIKHDFVRIRCFLKNNEGKVDAKKNENLIFEMEETEDKSNRRLPKDNKHKSELVDSSPVKNQRYKNYVPSNVVNTSYKETLNRNSESNIESLTSFSKVPSPKSFHIKIRELLKTDHIPGSIDNGHDMASPTREVNYDDDEMNSDQLHYLFEEYLQPEYDQFLAQVYPKQDVFQRIAKDLGRRREQKYMDVLMIGWDSMSRLAYQRKLPKTYAYLKEKLGAVVLEGYNIVGDATTAAIIPMLTGKTERELPDIRANQFDSHMVDVYPLIWKKFRHHGYATMFAEDDPTISIFNLRFSGFLRPPTDHYMRPFWQAVWGSEVRSKSQKFCTGSQPNHKYLFDYTKDFFIQYRNVSKFAFVFGCELTHANNNPGEHMDSDFLSFIRFLNENGYLDNTLLIVMSDHGARYSRVRNTMQGKMEERLPMMSLRFPDWFKTAYSEAYNNLVNNAQRLATPFDIHETLRDILDLSRTKSKVNHTSRGISLLRPVPLNRTCASAGIQMHWCMCLTQYALDGQDKGVIQAADAVIKQINRETEFIRTLCRKLEIRKIRQAYLLIPNEKVLMFQTSRGSDQGIPVFNGTRMNIDHMHIQVTLETRPNGGLYESTVQVNVTSGSYEVIGEVSRLDRYGNQPSCIQIRYPDLRKFCLCVSVVKSERHPGGNDHSQRPHRRQHQES